MPSLSPGTIAILLAACGCAAWTDLRTGLIPNRLTAIAAMAGLVVAGIEGGVRGLAAGVCGALVAALVPLLLFRKNAMGGGDVKLFLAIGAISGTAMALEIQMMAFATGSLFGIGLWIRRGLLTHKVAAFAGFCRRRFRAADAAEERTEIRFAPFILMAALMVIAAHALRTEVLPW